jgi:hypothetical protein
LHAHSRPRPDRNRSDWGVVAATAAVRKIRPTARIRATRGPNGGGALDARDELWQGLMRPRDETERFVLDQQAIDAWIGRLSGTN